jgi:myosin heavy subunit
MENYPKKSISHFFFFFECFSIHHFAGIVTYDVKGWLLKDNDKVMVDFPREYLNIISF